MNQNELKIIDLSSEVNKIDGSNNGIWYCDSRVDLTKDLIIGFSPTNYHCFIICGKYEFHPRFTTNPCLLKPSRIDNIRAAIFIRYTHLSNKQFNDFQNFLLQNKGKHTPSCQEGLLQILEKGLGLRLKNVEVKNIYPLTFLKELLYNGLIDSQNATIPFEVYTTRDKSIPMVFSEIELVEKRIGWIFDLSSFLFQIFRYIFPNKIVK